MRSGSHSLTSSFKSCSLKLFGQIVRDVNGLVSKQPGPFFISFFFFFSCSRFVKQEQESILMVQRSTDIVYITAAAVVYGGLDRLSEDVAEPLILKQIVSQTP